MGRIVSHWTITNGLIVPMNEGPRSFQGYVRIAGGAITEVGEGTPAADGQPIIDAGGCVVMPGLVNAHTHLYQVLLRAVPR